MLFSELKKDEIYSYIDKKIPLKYTGISEDRNQFNSYSKIASFNPVKTEQNKNWIDEIEEITIAFGEIYETNDFENFYVKPLI